MLSKNPADTQKYKQKHKKYKKHSDNVKKKYRATYKEKLADIKDMSSIDNSIGKPQTPNIGTIQRPDGSCKLPGKETLGH